jgi:hypothetical protein
MAKYIVNHRAGLFLPGAEAASPHGAEVEADAKNAAVAGWLEAGMLVKPKDFARPAASSADPALTAALEQAQADLTERDAIIAAQTAQIAQLTADLEAATKPQA